METVKILDTNFTIWDVGGRGNHRPLWRHYYQHTSALIFVVDSTDRKRIEEGELNVKRELAAMMSDHELSDVVLLVLANKQDIEGAMDISEVKERMGVEAYQRPFLVQPCCATTGQGLQEGMEWLARVLSANKKSSCC